jgi:hypothetical protein
MITRALTLLTLAAATAAAAQDLGRRVAAAPDGQVRLSYAARPGIYGNGRNMISWDCRGGHCRSQNVDGNWDEGEGRSACDSGPVRLALTVRSGAVTALRVYVGGSWRPTSAVTDLGTVSTKEATKFLLDLAVRSGNRAGREAIFPAMLADSVTLWPDLLRLARDTRLADETRKSAVFWLGQAAEASVTEQLASLVDEDTLDREVKETAVFALSQRPREEGVPALIHIARSHRDGDVRRKALFWLGQSGDPRAIALFEEILTKP